MSPSVRSFPMAALLGLALSCSAEDFPKPYAPPCTERENSFEFTEKPTVKLEGEDRYRITFAVKAACDVAVAIVDEQGKVVRHLGAGVLGANAPQPFQQNSLKQELYWNGKDDLEAYPKEPEQLLVRVMLGLKPEFDKRLGGTSPHNLPGYVWGIAIGPEGAYVFPKGQGAFGVVNLRKYDHDGKYLASLVPPPPGLPEEKLSGMAYVEYEKGLKALHEPRLDSTISRDGFLLPGVNGKSTLGCQVALANGRLYFCNSGAGLFAGNAVPSTLYYLHTDGSTDLTGMRGLPLAEGEHLQPRFASSPDGRWLYLAVGHAVLRRAVEGPQPAKAFVGTPNKPGSDNLALNGPVGLDCDAQGRLYVCDAMNNRVQVFAPDGKHLQTIALESPTLVRVHQKTGALYVKHAARVQGQKTDRISKLTSLEKPNEEFHLDGVPGALLSLDSWTPKPRLWLAGSGWDTGGSVGSFGRGPSVMIYEEDGKELRKILDFDEEAKREAGGNYLGRWSGVGAVGDKVVCDPNRETAYYQGRHLFNLATGAYRGAVQIPKGGIYDDIAFDKRGYLHLHLNPGFDSSRGGVVRVNPDQGYTEVPYDYGVEKPGHYCPERAGALPVRDQPGSKFFQDGIGVNMRGDVAENCNIYYVPKMEEAGWQTADAGRIAQGQRGEYTSHKSGAGASLSNYEGYLRSIQELQKRGEEVYFITRRPGVSLAGATIWTFDRTGELRAECAVTAGGLVNGPQLDEDGRLYFVTNRIRLHPGQTPFLAGSTGVFGDPAARGRQTLKAGTMLKTRGEKVSILSTGTPIGMDPPQRPAELVNAAHGVLGSKCWVEGAEWFYAGAGPITFEGCSCPAQRLHLDWYKRSYVPESYRHSIGILDTNGNLILHLGRYGNLDSLGPHAKAPIGGDPLAAFVPRYLGGTDNHLVYDFRGEALVVLRLKYHAEETVPVRRR